ncbi:hypothetical protein AVDCRST_MAG94-2896 [uncultured Leptolyngbya sp.]|uniref:Uncharacterized protein n=1 Tax=uncultured Leptolyngbya sp. TaxID=332963 RepID=A0A6J4M9V4_9CYAN|nr:hypothetical protein AVDCRST_MAG94-2896 [uncultured Leptolyngbya sp.]
MNINDPFESYTPVEQDFRNSPTEDLWTYQDFDGDGLTNQQEMILGTNPYSADSDWDGLSDSQELAMGTNPLLPDTDWGRVRDDVDLWNSPAPSQTFSLPEDSRYQDWSQGLDPNLPPFLQVKQVAQAALNEDYTIPQVHNILSEAPRYKEIEATLGPDKAEQFAEIAITAAQRQTAINSLPPQPTQREPQAQKQRKLGTEIAP